MDIFHALSLIIGLSAVFAWINHKYIRLPSAIGLMVLALGLSLVILFAGAFFPEAKQLMTNQLRQLSFPQLLLDIMLSFILFAGALHTEWNVLRKSFWPILTFSTLGVLISTFLIGAGFYYCLGLFEIEANFIQCLIFGALISPTDPIAVLGILKNSNLPKSVNGKITGESLFNDGMGIVLFITLLNIAEHGISNITAGLVSELFLKEVLGGLGIGFISGYLTVWMMHRIDHYQTEVMLTLAVVTVGYSIAQILHFSGPLAMVVAGLVIGERGKRMAMSETTLDYLNRFWEVVDEFLNSILFVLIGLELLLITFHTEYWWLGMVTTMIVIFARYLTLFVPYQFFKVSHDFQKNSLLIMTWGGLKGGISIALALSIPERMGRELLVPVTYVVVLFSILLQGGTIGRIIKRLNTSREN